MPRAELTGLTAAEAEARLASNDGIQVRIAGREVVRGDTVLLAEGDRVRAGRVRQLLRRRIRAHRRIRAGAEATAHHRAGVHADGEPGGDGTPLSSEQKARRAERDQRQ